ncbi:Unannotated [Lentimonas sp. CC19]|nr:Unannotated [Lentimonas sp. CC10]CAA6693070.1 Unannotated [Lentimonas sp. CC19]
MFHDDTFWDKFKLIPLNKRKPTVPRRMFHKTFVGALLAKTAHVQMTTTALAAWLCRWRRSVDLKPGSAVAVFAEQSPYT